MNDQVEATTWDELALPPDLPAPPVRASVEEPEFFDRPEMWFDPATVLLGLWG